MEFERLISDFSMCSVKDGGVGDLPRRPQGTNELTPAIFGNQTEKVEYKLHREDRLPMQVFSVDELSLHPTQDECSPMHLPGTVRKTLESKQSDFADSIAINHPCETALSAKISPEKQREIVMGVLRESWELNPLEAPTDGRSLLSSNLGAAGDTRFLVNAKWWNKWCDFVNFESVGDYLTQKRQGGLTGRVGEDMSDKLFPSAFYGNPGKIFNACLLENGRVKQNLVEFIDFVSLPEGAWRYLQEWYGADEEVSGLLRKDLLHNELMLS